jgi:hypothetical protein
MANDVYISADEFGDDKFLKVNAMFIERYVTLRARTIPSLAAFRRIFGAVNCDQGVYTRIQNLEASDLYNDLFEAKLKSMPLDELLSPRKALHAYLDIAANPMAKDSAKIAALKEACVIANITVIDEKGQTRAGRDLSDFYADVPANPAHDAAVEAVANPKPSEPAKLH